jgi:hypothetical protein
VNDKTYSGFITSLEPNQVFVFGSNYGGFHGGGAAGFASFGKVGNHWRAEGYDRKPKGWKGKWNVKGIARGFQEGRSGCSYGIPTVTKPGARRSIPLEVIQKSVVEFYDFAKENPDMEFLVAYSAANKNLNGYAHEEMASVFVGDIPDNVVFEEGFHQLIKDEQEKGERDDRIERN